MRRDRRRLLGLAGGALAVAALPALGQRGPLPRVGYLLLQPPSDPPTRERQAFLDGLRERGWVPGKSVDIVYRSAQNEHAFLGDMCQELLTEKVRVIVAGGGFAVLAAKKCTQSVPIVFQAVGNPVGIGVVKSLARPEGNVTGVSFVSSDLAAKRVELVRELLPSAKKVAVLWNRLNPDAGEETKATVESAKRIGMQVIEFGVSSGAELRQTLRRIEAERPDALCVVVDGDLVSDHRTHIAQFGRERRILVVSAWGFLTEAGGLVSYGPDMPTIFRRSASYVDRILRGAKPAELPVEEANTFELVINLATAKALGIKVSHSFLVRADRVIQ